jgi:hypothetical protein
MPTTTIIIVDETYDPNVVVTTTMSLKPHKQEGSLFCNWKKHPNKVDVGNKSLVTNDNEEVIFEKGKTGGEAISKQVVIVHQGATTSQ